MKNQQDSFNDFLNVAEALQAGMWDNAGEALEGAEVTGELKTPLLDYPEIGDMIEYLAKYNDKPPVPINLKSLCKNGEVKAEPMETYLASKHLPSSGLKEVLKNPASFFFYLNDRSIIFENKPYFELGTFVHMAFLEPKLFKMVKVEPKVSLASTEGCKTLLEFYRKLNKTKTPLDYGTEKEPMKIAEIKALAMEEKQKCKFLMVQQDHATIIGILERNYKMYGGGIIPMLMKGARIETSFYGTDHQTGLKVKVRPDAFNTIANIGVNAVISFKTTSAASVEQFIAQTAKLQYELSEGMYQEVISDVTGIKFDTTIMIMLQTVPPFLPAVLWWSPEDLQNGKYKYRYALDTAKDCLTKNLYPGFESLAESGNFGIINMKQPTWSHKLLKPVDIEN